MKKRHPELIFHKFLAQDELMKAWIFIIRRDPGPLFNVRHNTPQTQTTNI